MTFDWTIRFDNVLMFGGLAFAAARHLLSQRDIQRDLTAITKDHEDRLTKVEEVTGEHHEWLIGANLDRRTGLDRRQ